MTKSKLIKWVVAVALAVPAIPALATTVHHRKLTHSTRTHKPLIASSKRHHVYHSTKHRVTQLTTHRHVTRKLSSTHHVRRTSLSSKTANQPFHVHFTKMPPTIDGINT